ncbi:MAG: hypothetical protein U1E74_05765 [Paenacidovorax caeni]
MFRDGADTATGSGDDYFNRQHQLNAGNAACVTPGAVRGYDREEQTKNTFVISPDTP